MSDRTLSPHPNSKSDRTLCLSSFRPTGDRTSIFTLLYDKGLTLANFLGTILPWENVPAYRLCTYHFKNTDYTD